MPGYDALGQLLNQQGVGLTPAEMHGLISGMLCGGNKDASWRTLLHELTNEGLAFSQDLSDTLGQMHSATGETLEDDGFNFQLFLPAEEASVFDRADALAGWVNHFLLGLGVSQPGLDKVKGKLARRSTICVASPSWAMTRMKIRKSWKCRWRRSSSMCGLLRYSATTPSTARLPPRRRYRNRRFIKLQEVL